MKTIDVDVRYEIFLMVTDEGEKLGHRNYVDVVYDDFQEYVNVKRPYHKIVRICKITTEELETE